MYQSTMARDLRTKSASAPDNSATAATPEQLATEIKRIGDETKAFAERAVTEIKTSASISTQTKSAVDQLLTDKGLLEARLKSVEDELVVRTTKGRAPEEKTVGQQVVESDAVKHLASGSAGRVAISVKNLINSSFSVRPDRVESVVPLPQMRMTVRDLIAPGRTSSSSIEYVRETGFVNAATIVAEGALKPESSLTFDVVVQPVVTVAHWLRASKQILADAPMLQSFIDQRLRYGLQLVEEAQLLKGSGASGNLLGLYTAATAYAAPATVANANAIDTIRLGLLQAELADYPANGIVLNPIDWALIELTKSTTGEYLFSNPAGQTTPRLWGRDVVTTRMMDARKFLIGAFRLAAQVFDREDANVVISTEDQDNFVRNLVTIRAEERLALAIYRPEALVKGDLPS